MNNGHYLTYKLAGVTFNTPGHFVAIIVGYKGNCFYYDSGPNNHTVKCMNYRQALKEMTYKSPVLGTIVYTINKIDEPGSQKK